MPQRLRGRVAPRVAEIAIGVALPLLALALRAPLEPLLRGEVPYAFMFIAVVLAAVLAGWRSGLTAIVVGQLLTWYFVVEPVWSFALPDPARRTALIVATLSEVVTLAFVAMYQREVDRASVEREQRMDLLSEALREIDHRTKNNYQTVLALIQLQAQRASDSDVKAALQQVADRIQAVTVATEHLALRSEDLGTVRLADHLCELCEQVERGLSREGVEVQCEVDDLSASTEKAIYLSIIVNELVTNALKHAFRERSQGIIRVTSEVNGERIAIIVEDNGCGLKSTPSPISTGLGTRLVERFARQLGATHEVISSSTGTRHRLLVASLA